LSIEGKRIVGGVPTTASVDPPAELTGAPDGDGAGDLVMAPSPVPGTPPGTDGRDDEGLGVGTTAGVAATVEAAPALTAPRSDVGTMANGIATTRPMVIAVAIDLPPLRNQPVHPLLCVFMCPPLVIVRLEINLDLLAREVNEIFREVATKVRRSNTFRAKNM
jgi:hypothetical protein